MLLFFLRVFCDYTSEIPEDENRNRLKSKVQLNAAVSFKVVEKHIFGFFCNDRIEGVQTGACKQRRSFSVLRFLLIVSTALQSIFLMCIKQIQQQAATLQ